MGFRVAAVWGLGLGVLREEVPTCRVCESPLKVWAVSDNLKAQILNL